MCSWSTHGTPPPPHQGHTARCSHGADILHQPTLLKEQSKYFFKFALRYCWDKADLIVIPLPTVGHDWGINRYITPF